MKGITPVVSIVILLLIVVALAGSAFTFLSGYYEGLTGNAIALTDTTCSGGVAQVLLRNIGTEPIFIGNQLMHTEPYVNDPDTVLLYHLDENQGLTAVDSSANGFDGTLADFDPTDVIYTDGDTPPIWTSGKFGVGLDFDNLDSIVTGPDDILLEPATWTIEAWMRSTESDHGPIITKYDSASLDGYVLDINSPASTQNGELGITSDVTALTGLTGFNDGLWHHVAGVFDAGTLSLYVDGIFVSSSAATYTGPVPVGIFLFVGYYAPTTRVFDGVIDEVRVSNTVRDFTDPTLQGWNYECQGSGDDYTCGGIVVTKTAGGGTFSPGIDKGTVNPGEIFRLKDGDCQGVCHYSIASTGFAIKSSVFC